MQSRDVIVRMWARTDWTPDLVVAEGSRGQRIGGALAGFALVLAIVGSCVRAFPVASRPVSVSELLQAAEMPPPQADRGIKGWGNQNLGSPL